MIAPSRKHWVPDAAENHQLLPIIAFRPHPAKQVLLRPLLSSRVSRAET